MGSGDTESDDGADVCGFEGTHSGDPCQNQATESDGSCYLDTHAYAVEPAESESDGRGPPEGSQNALGNDGGAPEGNMNGVKHGLHLSVRRRLKHFDGEQRDLFEAYYAEFARKSPNSEVVMDEDGTPMVSNTQAAALATLAVIRDTLELEIMDEGAFFEKMADGETIRMPKSGTLEAYTDALREMRLGMKYEGMTAEGSGSGGGHQGVENLWEGEEQ